MYAGFYGGEAELARVQARLSICEKAKRVRAAAAELAALAVTAFVVVALFAALIFLPGMAKRRTAAEGEPGGAVPVADTDAAQTQNAVTGVELLTD